MLKSVNLLRAVFPTTNYYYEANEKCFDDLSLKIQEVKYMTHFPLERQFVLQQSEKCFWGKSDVLEEAVLDTCACLFNFIFLSLGPRGWFSSWVSVQSSGKDENAKLYLLLFLGGGGLQGDLDQF